LLQTLWTLFPPSLFPRNGPLSDIATIFGALHSRTNNFPRESHVSSNSAFSGLSLHKIATKQQKLTQLFYFNRYAMGRANVEEAERAFTDSVLLFQNNINNYLQRQAEQKQVVSTYNSKTNQWESSEVKNENILDLERRGPFSNRVFSTLDPFQRFMLLRTLGTLKVDLYISSETDKSAQMRGKVKLLSSNQYYLHITLQSTSYFIIIFVIYS
jgi:hypothetical protein